MPERIHPEVLRRLEANLRGPGSKRFTRDFQVRYNVKNEEKVRDRQFLRPELHVTVPHGGRGKRTTISAQITNRGGTACYNAVVKLLVNRIDGTTGEYQRHVIPTIAAGQTVRQDFAAIFGLIQLYQVVCFDPFFDPISQDDIPKLIPGNFNLLSSDLSLFGESRLTNSYEEDGNTNTWTSAPLARALKVDFGFTPSAVVTTGTTTANSPPISQLRRTVKLQSNLGPEFVAAKTKGDLIVNIGAGAILQKGRDKAQPKIGLVFLDMAGNSMGTSIFDAIEPDAVSGTWYFTSIAQSIPATADGVTLRLICDKRGVSNPGIVSFFLRDFYVTHRQVFASNRW